MAKEAQIQRFAGLSGIRKKSTVYIGPNNSDGLWTIFREPADNFVDRALKGKNKYGHLIVDPNGKGYWVIDKDDEGFPVSIAVFEDERGRKEKLSQFYAATGLTHAGSNFDSDAISRGTHGIGIKATNAMSKVFQVWTCKPDGQWYTIVYKDAKLSQDVAKSKAPKLPHGIKAVKGSVIYFEPDMSLFTKDAKMSLTDANEWATLTSYLVPNLQISITTKLGKTKAYKTKGISEYIDNELLRLKATAIGKTFVHQNNFVDVAIAFANAEGNELIAYTNGLKNVDGGEHVKAVMDALVKSLKPYKGKLEYTPTDLRDGLVGLINAKIAAPKFSNQRKDRLDDERAYDPTFNSTFKAFEEFWKKHKSMATEVSRRAAELRKKTADFLKDKKLLSNVKKASGKMSAKLSDIANSKTPVEMRELFLVEGDSAAGTAKKARNQEYQATYALRGKPLNVMDAAKDKINNNEEVTGILAAIGLGSGKGDEIRYGKIIFLADPDIDGKHINCLLMTVFWKFMPNLYRQGKIFMLKAPEYYAMQGKEICFGSTPEDVYKKTGTTKSDVRHIKGWGELDADKMEPMAFEKGRRQLIRLMPPDTPKGKTQFEALMGKNSAYRQKMLGVAE